MLIICTACGYEWNLEPRIHVDTTREDGTQFPILMSLEEHMDEKKPAMTIPVCGRCAPEDVKAAVLKTEKRTIIQPDSELWKGQHSGRRKRRGR